MNLETNEGELMSDSACILIGARETTKINSIRNVE